MIDKIKKKLNRYFTLLIGFSTNFLFHINAYATGESAGNKIDITTETQPMGGGSGGGGGAEDELKKFLIGDKGLMTFVSQAGMVLIAFGIGQLILAFKDDNPEAKSRGTMILLGGVFCVTISKILENLGVTL